MAFNRDRNSRSGGGFRPARYASRSDAGGPRPRFSGPAEMHSAVCDNCGKNCEVPFRPTSGKPVYCSNCFENKQGFSSNQRGSSDSGNGRRYERRAPERSDNGLAEVNAKLDTILQLLESQKPVVKDKPVKIKEIETVEAEEPTP